MWGVVGLVERLFGKVVEVEEFDSWVVGRVDRPPFCLMLLGFGLELGSEEDTASAVAERNLSKNISKLVFAMLPCCRCTTISHIGNQS